MALHPRRAHPDVIAAWAVATGVGLIVLVLAWNLGSRATAIPWGSPIGPSLALAGAIVAGGLAGALTGRRLTRSLRGRRHEAPDRPPDPGHAR